MRWERYIGHNRFVLPADLITSKVNHTPRRGILQLNGTFCWELVPMISIGCFACNIDTFFPRVVHVQRLDYLNLNEE